MDQSSAGLGHRTPGPEASLCLHMFMGGQGTCFALRGFLSLALTAFSFQVLPLFVFWTFSLPTKGEGP